MSEEWQMNNDNEWQKNVQERHCVDERIIYMKIKYDRRQLVALHAYAPEEGTKIKVL